MTTKPTKPKFGTRLAALRRVAGLTQREFAAKSGIAQAAIARYESGREPTWELACRIADSLGISVEAFRSEPSRRDGSRGG